MMETYIGKTIPISHFSPTMDRRYPLAVFAGQKVLLYFFTSPAVVIEPAWLLVPRACCRVHREERRAVRNP